MNPILMSVGSRLKVGAPQNYGLRAQEKAYVWGEENQSGGGSNQGMLVREGRVCKKNNGSYSVPGIPKVKDLVE